MNIRYIVELGDEERAQLQELTGGGKARVRRVKRAQILLAAEQGHGDAAIATTVGVGTSTVYRTKRRFVEEGLEMALSEQPRVGSRRKLTGREETLLVAVACSDPPVGSIWWRFKLGYWVSSAWTGILKTATPCAVNSRIGSVDATPKGLGSSGCSMSIAPARNWPKSIPRQSPLASIRLPEPVKIIVQRY